MIDPFAIIFGGIFGIAIILAFRIDELILQYVRWRKIRKHLLTSAVLNEEFAMIYREYQ